MRYRSILAGAIFIVMSAYPFQQGLSQESTSGIAPDQQRPSAPNIAIGAGDLLNIVVFDTPELTTSARVSQDGDVNLPVLGLMKLAGMNTIDAAHRIEDELRT